MRNVEEVERNIFKVEVPLPHNPLKAINSYIIKAQQRALIVDTGMNREECFKTISEAIGYLGVDLNSTEFFITHMHADHSGLIRRLSKPTSLVYFSQEDKPFIVGLGDKEWDFWLRALKYAKRYGFPGYLSEEAIYEHPGYKYSPRGKLEGKIEIVDDGDVLRFSDVTLKCIKTPGHTRGHMCLYDEEKALLFSGDHILYDITPNISSAYENPDPLGEYLNSLDKVYDLNVRLVLPGHRRIFKDLKERIDELRKHHKERLDEILNILNDDGCQNAYEVASKMKWDIKFENWHEFPLSQKWFAHSEAVAHLQYLRDLGKVSSKVVEGVWIFCIDR